MRHKRLAAVLLTCVLLFSCSFIPAAAAEEEIPVSNSAISQVSGRLNHSLPANRVTPITQALYFDKGDIISFVCSYTPKSASLDFGYINSDNVFRYLNCTSGNIDKSIELDVAGQYTLAIRNNESYAVIVTGTVKY